MKRCQHSHRMEIIRKKRNKRTERSKKKKHRMHFTPGKLSVTVADKLLRRLEAVHGVKEEDLFDQRQVAHG